MRTLQSIFPQSVFVALRSAPLLKAKGLGAAVLGAAVLGATMLTALGCASSSHSKQFVDAQKVYEHARLNHGQTYAPAELADAKKYLVRADEAKDGSDDEVQWAYLADRQARLAESRGATKYSQTVTAEANAQYVQGQEKARENAERELSRTRDKLNASDQGRIEAEAQVARAMASLEQLAAVKEDARETVITLSGSVLFKTGEAALLPVAEQSLTEVAEALKTIAGESVVKVEGYTDSRGTEEANLALSRARAEAVRSFLTSRGMKPDQLKAEGRGESNPVADNNTAEGRANNRRVELIVQKASPESEVHAGL
jgi:outer membrane protein OmpA-like peptidoglycan-associated protein